MANQVSSVDPDEVKLPDQTDDEHPSRDLNLNDLADRMDSHARSRAVERIIAHHQALRRDLDKMCSKLGEQAETISELETRLALLEGDGDDEEKTKSARGKPRGAGARGKEVSVPKSTEQPKSEDDQGKKEFRLILR